MFPSHAARELLHVALDPSRVTEPADAETAVPIPEESPTAGAAEPPREPALPDTMPGAPLPDTQVEHHVDPDMTSLPP